MSKRAKEIRRRVFEEEARKAARKDAEKRRRPRTPEQHRVLAAGIAVRVEVSVSPVTSLNHASLSKDEFRQLLRRLGFRSYSEYLWSPLWLDIRSRVFKRARKRCEDCGGRATQVHHVHYSIENLTGESLEGLVAICDGCHEKRHARA